MARHARVLAMIRPGETHFGEPRPGEVRPGDGENFAAPEGESPRTLPLRLKKRADFVAAAKGRRQHQRCFVLQTRQRKAENATEAAEAPRFGFTVTKKVGNSVVRNRIRRRLREALRLADFSLPKPDHDYVLVARIEALSAPFEELREDLARALTRIHQSGPKGRPPASPAADRKQDA